MAVYACGDLHGHREVYDKICEILKPGDKVFCVGDCCDRGPQSWETVQAVYNDPRFIYLKGNHEDMLVKACEDYLDTGTWQYDSYRLSKMNGGEDTMDAWERDPLRGTWYHRLRKLPTWDSYENENGVVIVLSHAGFTPWLVEGTYDECSIPDDETLLWDRDHFLDEYDSAEMDNVIIVHGHTPSHYLSIDLWKDWDGGAFWYCDDHKVCIDSGGFFSSEFVLLNLDTLEDTIIKLDKKS